MKPIGESLNKKSIQISDRATGKLQHVPFTCYIFHCTHWPYTALSTYDIVEPLLLEQLCAKYLEKCVRKYINTKL